MTYHIEPEVSMEAVQKMIKTFSFSVKKLPLESTTTIGLSWGVRNCHCTGPLFPRFDVSVLRKTLEMEINTRPINESEGPDHYRANEIKNNSYKHVNIVFECLESATYIAVTRKHRGNYTVFKSEMILIYLVHVLVRYTT